MGGLISSLLGSNLISSYNSSGSLSSHSWNQDE